MAKYALSYLEQGAVVGSKNDLFLVSYGIQELGWGVSDLGNKALIAMCDVQFVCRQNYTNPPSPPSSYHPHALIPRNFHVAIRPFPRCR